MTVASFFTKVVWFRSLQTYSQQHLLSSSTISQHQIQIIIRLSRSTLPPLRVKMILIHAVTYHSGNDIKNFKPIDSDLRIQQRELLESLVTLIPTEKAAFPIHFMCCLLRCAICLQSSCSCKNELEKWISLILEHVTVEDPLVLSLTYDEGRLFDLDSIRKIITGFVEKEKSMVVSHGGDFKEVSSSPMQRVDKTVDAYLAEIASVVELTMELLTMLRLSWIILLSGLISTPIEY